MNKIKDLIIVFFGITALVGLIGAIIPTTTQGQGGGSSKDVNVVNTPTVQAQQSGAWNVGITGTPTVNLANDSSVRLANTEANPALVRDVDNSARQFAEISVQLTMPPGDPVDTKTLDIPTNKRFVIKHVSVFARMPAGHVPYVSFNTPNKSVVDPDSLVSVGHYLSLTKIGSEVGGNFDVYSAFESTEVATSSVFLEDLRVTARRVFLPNAVINSQFDADVSVTFSGYLVNVP